jgi:uncharacterized protein
MTAVGDVLGRGISFPPRIGADGRVAWSEGEANIREAIRVTLLVAPGERLRRPTFGAGLEAYLFEPNTTATRHEIEERVRRTIVAWEPRVVVQGVDVVEDREDPNAAIATITFRIVATGSVERVSAAIALNG